MTYVQRRSRNLRARGDASGAAAGHTRLVSGSPAVARAHRPPAVAVGVVSLLGVLAAFITVHLPADAPDRRAGPLAVALVVAAVVATAGTVRWPLPATVLVGAALAGYVGRQYPHGPIYACGIVAMFVVGWRAGRGRAIAALAAIELGLVAGWLVAGRGGALVAFYPGWAAAAGAVGSALGSRRMGRAEEKRRRVAEERLQIARDLHDGVAHAMATINVQAAAAAHVIDRQPAAARAALGAIAQASGAVLDELNAMLALLREPGTPVDRAPTPRLADVAELVDNCRRAGRECEYRSSGGLDAVPASVATAAFRIVQESLTNVLKHSDARRVVIELQAAGGGLALSVADDGTPRGKPRPGNGLRGMHERAEATGGRLSAGPTASGFAVEARWEPS